MVEDDDHDVRVSEWRGRERDLEDAQFVLINRVWGYIESSVYMVGGGEGH